ncbi:HzsA-related protein [Lignipirellula cremea]|uniref:Cytochrome c domain-containing protein n=1 Tax=Lignipirellula cremea TaxID=2528010 RepID=A0A518E349_9BACT|nr:hypothetical protein [Lignipirellula cremea]QDU98521.1 hypothetical protein Pla8534_63900 [Lignipirellula cremea]
MPAAVRNLLWLLLLLAASPVWAEKHTGVLNIKPAEISSDASVKYDYPIVYVRSPRWVEDRGEQRPARWAEFAHAFSVTPGSDLMLLYPDGKEELLVAGGEGAVQDPYVSFDGETVYYTHFHQATSEPNAAGADIYRIHVPSRKIVQLTKQEFAPSYPGEDQRYGVYHMHPCPVPGGRVAFVSSRNGYLPSPKSYPQISMQLHTMDDDGQNLETIGHFNLAGALHPVILKDGRLLFSSLENMGLRNYILWGIWSIHPDGSNWAPVVSALHGHSSPSAWHFQTQLSDENVVVELYYNQNQKGFGSLFRIPPTAPAGESAFGPGDIADERNPGWDFLGYNGKSFRVPFTPNGMTSLTPWIRTNDFPAWPADAADENSPRIGKVTHPCGAPDNHLLLSWTLGPIGGSAGAVRPHMGPQPIDSGIYLVKNAEATTEPGQMLLIKNDPKYNEQWPRPLVSYQRVYGVAEPKNLSRKTPPQHAEQLPPGTPFGLVGTSSFYKRESAPMGQVEPGSVTSTFPKNYRGQSWNPYDSEFTGTIWNWQGQGSDAGRYDNSDIHAVRILAFEPNASTKAAGNRYGYPAFSNHAMERLRILGEVPLRKFQGEQQPLDPDGNPDTSFLARIPADVAFTFQTIDRRGMVLNMAQTWHQVRPGEARQDCGGCHAHSQQPTLFEDTIAATPNYEVFDLTDRTPLLTSPENDASGQRWDADNATGLRYVDGPQDVEYHRDIKPIFARSCVACHSGKTGKAAAGLVLDDDETLIDNLPGTYFRLAEDQRARFSPRRLEARNNGEQYVVRDLFHRHMGSHYVWKFQSRRSLLAWKIFGERLDGWDNDEIPSEFVGPTDPRRKLLHLPGGEAPTAEHRLYLGDIDFTGSIMPPPAAVAQGKAAALSDEDRRTIVRWIDLGCPIDLANLAVPKAGERIASGFLDDDQRPTLTLAQPARIQTQPLQSILIGMHDYNSGLDLDSFEVTADFPVNGAPAGENLASQFQSLPGYRWELKLDQPLALQQGKVVVLIKDQQGNQSQIDRVFTQSGK